jgi:hypothetical protein
MLTMVRGTHNPSFASSPSGATFTYPGGQPVYSNPTLYAFLQTQSNEIITTASYPIPANTYDAYGAASVVAAASLPIAGGAMTGRLALVGEVGTITTQNTSALPYTTLFTDNTIILTGSTASKTLTLGTTSFVAGQRQYVKNQSTKSVSVNAATGTVDKTSLAPNEGGEFAFDGTNWNSINTSQGQYQFGQQVAYNQVTSGFNTGVMSAATWFSAASVGSAPTITLPNDGNIYRVEFQASTVSATPTSGGTSIAIGTSTSTLYGISENAGTSATLFSCYVLAAQVTGSGQTVSVYARAVNASVTVSFAATALGSGGQGPAFIAAYRVN